MYVHPSKVISLIFSNLNHPLHKIPYLNHSLTHANVAKKLMNGSAVMDGKDHKLWNQMAFGRDQTLPPTVCDFRKVP